MVKIWRGNDPSLDRAGRVAGEEIDLRAVSTKAVKGAMGADEAIKGANLVCKNQSY